MSSCTDPPAPPRGHPSVAPVAPVARAALLPVLLWLNRRDLTTRFPGWQPSQPLSPYTDGSSTPTYGRLR